MKITSTLVSCALSALASLSLQVQAQPVGDSLVGTIPFRSPQCQNRVVNTIEIKSDINSQVFQDNYYNNRTVYVPRIDDLYLDSVDFDSTCGTAYCNKEAKATGIQKRATKHVASPKGSDCVVPTLSVSTFKCKSGKKGKVVVTVNEQGKASFEATDAVAYFGSWVFKGKDGSCVTAAKKGESTSPIDKDFLIVDCSASLGYSCSDIPSGPTTTQG